MTFEEQVALVRCVKGAGSSILWILLLSDDSLTAVELQEATGYSDKPVSQALARLKALGLVEHHGRAQGWRVSRSNWQEVTSSVNIKQKTENEKHKTENEKQKEQSAVVAAITCVSTRHNYSTGAISGPVRAERKVDSAVMAVESSASCVATEHKLSTGAEGEDADGPSAGGAAEINSASAVESSAATVDSTAVTVKNTAVTEVSTVARSSLSGPDFAAAMQKSGADRKTSAFPPPIPALDAEKIRIGASGNGAKRGRGVAEGQARVRVRNRSTTCYYCFYDVRSSKQVKRQAKARACARPPPRGLGISDLGFGIGDFGFRISGNGRGLAQRWSANERLERTFCSWSKRGICV